MSISHWVIVRHWSRYLNLKQLNDFNTILKTDVQSFLSFPSFLDSINIEVPAGGDFFVFYYFSRVAMFAVNWSMTTPSRAIAQSLVYRQIFIVIDCSLD